MDRPMGPDVTAKHLLGGAAILAALVFVHYGNSRSGAQPLHYDHTKTWRYAKVPHRDATNLERRLADVASLVAHRPVQVRCEGFPLGTPVETRGAVQFHGAEPADYARISHDVCTWLAIFMRAPTGADECVSNRLCNGVVVRFADALTVLAHESIHLRGLRTESVVQCYGMQEVPLVAKKLGASAEDARALAITEYSASYPQMPASYRSAKCRPGGALDLHPGGAWPD
jgi:hypothetical protein